MNPKAVFLEDKELVKWWVSVVHDSRWEKVGSLALATLAMRQSLTIEQLTGATEFAKILLTLPDSVPVSTRFPSPGLIHETPKRIVDNPTQPSPAPQPKPKS